MKIGLLFVLAYFSLHGYVIPEKVLICGVAKNVEGAIPNTIRSAEYLGSQFKDYRVIIYENNSDDGTKKLFKAWAKKNSKVTFISETLTHEQLDKEAFAGKRNRTETIARARNIVLNEIMKSKFDDFKYVVVADLDFAAYPWDVDNLVNTILYPEQEWDAVFANGDYDQFALRTSDIPIGYELVGDDYWKDIERIRDVCWRYYAPGAEWTRVYSAFGGLGIYKRESMRGCKYSGVVTKDLEKMMVVWLAKAYEKGDVPLLENYKRLLDTLPIYSISDPYVRKRNHYPHHMGLRLKNAFGEGQITWFSCEPPLKLPVTCEHIPFHASMILKGHDKLFINPKLISTVAGPQ